MKHIFHAVALACALTLSALTTHAAPLKIGYSDWPGWVAWEIGIQKGWFEEEGVDVEFTWFEYVPSMDAFAAGQIDAVCMTNGDALVTGSTGKACKGILINDFSNGNDMVVGMPRIKGIKDLKGKKVGVELGFVSHLLLLKALEANGMKESDVELLNVPTHETPQTLASGQVSAIVAWQPNSGEALKQVPGSRPIFSSADAPGIIYDLLYVSNESLAANREDWLKVVKVWGRIVEFINDKKNMTETLKILSSRVGLEPADYAMLLRGTQLLTLEESAKIYEKAEGLKSVYGSTEIVDNFNLDNKVYETSQKAEAYLDPSLVAELLK